jgi:oligo-alginate lyase
MAIEESILFMTCRFLICLTAVGGIGLVAYYCDWILLPSTSSIRKRILQSQARSGLFFFDEPPESIACRIENDPLLKMVFMRLDSEAEGMIRAPLCNHGDGGLPPEQAPQFLKRIFYLSFKHLKCRDRLSLEMILSDMRYISNMKSWNPSDHLAHSVVTAAMAIGYNWLGSNFDSADRTLFAEAILKKGLRAIYLPIPGNWWKFDSFNHAQVGYSCLGLAACALMKEFPRPASRIIALSIKNMSRAFKQAYRENGEYIEGTSYWIYGTSYSVLFLSALEKTFGHSFQLDDYPAFLNSARYFFHSHGPSRQVANFSDSNSSVGPVEIMFWFSKKLGASALSWFERQRLNLLHRIPIRTMWGPSCP